VVFESGIRSAHILGVLWTIEEINAYWKVLRYASHVACLHVLSARVGSSRGVFSDVFML